MKVRLILVCTLLLLAASTSFALPVCQDCNEFNRCQALPGAIEVCYDSGGGLYCSTVPDPCSPPLQATVLADWKVVSIEIDHPALASTTVKAPARVAEAPAPQPTTLK